MTAPLAVACLALSSTAVAGAAEPIPPNWAGRQFATRAQLAAWLRSRGADYAGWASLHPAAAAALEGRDLPSVPASMVRTDAHDRGRAALATAPRAAAPGKRSLSPVLVSIVAFLLVLTAALALTLAPWPAWGPLARIRGRRIELAAAAIAVVVGVLIARGLG